MTYGLGFRVQGLFRGMWGLYWGYIGVQRGVCVYIYVRGEWK